MVCTHSHPHPYMHSHVSAESIHLRVQLRVFSTLILMCTHSSAEYWPWQVMKDGEEKRQRQAEKRCSVVESYVGWFVGRLVGWLVDVLVLFCVC